MANHVDVAARVSAVKLLGPDDLTATVFGGDVVISKTVSYFSPYAGIASYWSLGHERTTKVNLDDESVLGFQGMIGIAARYKFLRIGTELNLAKVVGYSFKVGFGS